MPVAVLLISLLLFVSLGSLKSASIGFIALIGVTVEDGLVLVSFFDQLKKKGLAVREVVTKACRLRLRPITMTTLTTLLGLFPMLVATGSGSEIQKPPVAVVFGGLVTSLGLTLLVLRRRRPGPPSPEGHAGPARLGPTFPEHTEPGLPPCTGPE